MIHNYKKYVEINKLNENLFKKSWIKIIDYFKKKYNKFAWLYYAMFLKKNNELPKEKVEIYIPSSYNMSDIPTMKEVQNISESKKKYKYNVLTINEAHISLDHPNPNVRNVDVDGLVKKIIQVYQINADRVARNEPRKKIHALYIWGAPGIGKTEILRQVAEKLQIVVQEWHLSQIEPTDFRGMPKIENILKSDNPNDERTVSKLPAIFPTNDGPNGKGGIFFFDEINRAPKMVLSAALSLCLNGTVGTYELPPHWIVIAAGNRLEDLGGSIGTVIEPALSNRFSHVNYSPKVETWVKWALSQKHINPDLIIFLSFRKDFYHQLDSESETPNWPSPRTWEMASEKEYNERERNWNNPLSKDEIYAIYSDDVGTVAARTFIEYLELKESFDEKDIIEIYNTGKKAKQPPERLDRAAAAAAAIAYYKKDERLSESELKNVLEWMLSIEDIERRSSFLTAFKNIHSYIRDEEPWKTIYWDAAKGWYEDLLKIKNMT